MDDLWLFSALGTWSSFFLNIVGCMTIMIFVPMALWPLRWARVLNWSASADDRLAIYYGRCLGCVAAALGGASIYAAYHPVLQPFFFTIMLVNFASMVVVHVYGAVKRIQPAAETVETGLWLLLLLLAAVFFP